MKLTDTQLIILCAAAKHPERIALPLPNNLKGGAAQKVVASMIANGLLQEVDANMRVGDPVWRSTGDGHGNTLIATEAGLAAIGIDSAPHGATTDQTSPTTHENSEGAPKAHTPREGTKQAMLIDMLRKPEGATMEDIVAATGWQAHTVRGAMAGALKKKLGILITSEKDEARGRVYRIPAA